MIRWRMKSIRYSRPQQKHNSHFRHGRQAFMKTFSLWNIRIQTVTDSFSEPSIFLQPESFSSSIWGMGFSRNWTRFWEGRRKDITSHTWLAFQRCLSIRSSGWGQIADELRKIAVDMGIPGPYTSFRHMVCWNTIGLPLFGPSVATMRFFDTLNKIERELNSQESGLEAPEHDNDGIWVIW